jgi:hypothetical protein
MKLFKMLLLTVCVLMVPLFWGCDSTSNTTETSTISVKVGPGAFVSLLPDNEMIPGEVVHFYITKNGGQPSFTLQSTTDEKGMATASVIYEINPGDTLQVTASVPEANVEPVTKSITYSEIKSSGLSNDEVVWTGNSCMWVPIIRLEITPSSYAPVDWNVSRKVMPTPKYGTIDIDEAASSSKLDVSTMAGGVVRITGTMNNLKESHPYFAILAKEYTPGVAYPGVFTDKVPNVTFTTDDKGSYIWSMDLSSSNMGGPGLKHVSIWVNDAAINGTLLISNNFTVTIN